MLNEKDLIEDDRLYSEKDKDGFQTINLNETSNEIYDCYMCAAHGMIYANDSSILFDKYPTRAAVMMQMRFDGTIGFTGGLIDKSDKTVVDGLNREFKEEINMKFLTEFQQKDHLVCYINHALKIILHFYIKEISMSEFIEAENNALLAEHYGSETLGIIRVPCYIWNDNKRGLPIFLRNQFAGKAKSQLIAGLIKSGIFTQNEMNDILKLSENICFDL